MAVTKNSLEYQIKVTTDDAQKSVDNLAKKVDAVGTSADKSQTAFSNFSNKVKDSLQTAALPIIGIQSALSLVDFAYGKVKSAIDATVGSAKELKGLATKINSMLTDSVASSLNVKEGIQGIQAEFGMGKKDVASAFFTIMKSGAVDAAKAQEFLRQNIILGKTTFSDMETAARATIDVMQTYGKTSEDATEISGKLFLAVTRSKGSLEDYANSIGPAALAANKLGVSFDELLAIQQTLTKSGLTVSEAFGSTINAMTALAKQPPEMTRILKELRIESIQGAIAQYGFVGTLNKMTEASGGSSEALADLMGKAGATRVAIALTAENALKDTANFQNALAANTNTTTTEMSRSFEMLNNTTSAAMNRLKERVDVILANIGMNFTSSTKGIIGTLGDVAQAIIDFQNKLASLDLSGVFERNKIAIQAMTAAFTGFILIVNVETIIALASQMAVYTKSIWGAIAAKKALLLASAKFALIVAAIASVVIAIDLLARNFEKLPAIFTAGIMYIKKQFYSLKATVADTLGMDKTAELARKNLEEVSKEFEKTAQSISIDKGLLGDIQDVFKKLTDSTKESTTTIKNNMEKTAKASKEITKSVAGPLDPEILSRFNKLKEKLESLRSEYEKLTFGEEARIRLAANRELAEINAVEAALKASKKYTKEQKKLLDEERFYIDVITNAQIDAAREKAIKTSEEMKKIYATRKELSKIELEQQLRDIDAIAGALKGKDRLDPKIVISAKEEIKAQNLFKDKKALLDKREMLANALKHEEEMIKISYEKQLEDFREMMRKQQIDPMEFRELQAKLRAAELEDFRQLQLKKDQANRDFSMTYAERMKDTASIIELTYQNDLAAFKELMAGKEGELQSVAMYEVILAKKKAKELKDLEASQKTNYTKGMETAVAAIDATKNGAVSAISFVFNKFGAIGQIISSLISVFGQSKEEFKKWIDTLINMLLTLPDIIKDNIPVFITSIVQAIPSAIIAGFQTIFSKAEIPTMIADALIKALNNVAIMFPKMLGTIIKNAFKSVGIMWGLTKSIINSIVKGFQDAWKMVKNLFSGKDLYDGIFTGMEKSFAKVFSSKSFSGVSDELFGIKDLNKDVTNAAQNISKTFDEGRKTLVDNLDKWWKEFKNRVTKLFGEIGIDLKDKTQLAATAVADIVSGGLISSTALAIVAIEKIFPTIREDIKKLFDQIGIDLNDKTHVASVIVADVISGGLITATTLSIVALEKFFPDFSKNFKKLFEDLGIDLKDKSHLAGVAFVDAITGGMVQITTSIMAALGISFKDIKKDIEKVFEDIGLNLKDTSVKVGAIILEVLTGGLVSAIVAGLVFITKDTFKPIRDALSDLWKEILEKADFTGFVYDLGISLGKIDFKDFSTKFISDIGISLGKIDFNTKFISDISSAVSSGFSNANLAPLASKVSKIFSGDFSGILDPIKDFFTGPPSSSSSSSSTSASNDPFSWDWGNFMTTPMFSKGGPVYAAAGMMIPKGTDTVPAMLTPGEFVLNRQAVQGLGVPLLNSMNKNGRVPQQPNNVSVTLNITTEQPIDESFVKTKLMPTIKAELKRASIDGKRVLATSGVR